VSFGLQLCKYVLNTQYNDYEPVFSLKIVQEVNNVTYVDSFIVEDNCDSLF
jgi:hypothetical protein